MEKDILLHKDKFRKCVYLDFGYLNSDFKGDILRKKGDSLGGIIESITTNVPTGLGEPIFGSLESEIS